MERRQHLPLTISGNSRTNLVEDSSAVVGNESFFTEKVFKVIVLGDSGVGKTSLCQRLHQKKFVEKNLPTVGVDYLDKSFLIENDLVKMQIWDTAGQERFRQSFIPQYYRNVDAVIFVYDVARLNSLENLTKWVDECNKHFMDDSVIRLIIGNKCELQSKTVPTELAKRFAKSYMMPIFETSALDSSHQNQIDSIFYTLASKLLQKKHWSHGTGTIKVTVKTSQETNFGCCT